MKKRYLFSLAIICVLLLLFTINRKGHSYNNKTNNYSIKDNNHKLTWDEYQLLFKYIVNNINIKGLELKASTLGDNITAVDKELTFNKRQFLTIDGTFDNSSMKPTEEQIILEDDSQGKQFTISILYTDNYIDENLIGYPSNVGFDNLNETLVKKATYSILTYKNLVIVIHQISIDKYDLDLMYGAMKSLVDLLIEY